MEENIDIFELIYEGSKDDSIETIRNIKATFIIELNLDVEEVVSIFRNTPSVVLEGDSVDSLKIYLEKLTTAGAKAQIIKKDVANIVLNNNFEDKNIYNQDEVEIKSISDSDIDVSNFEKSTKEEIIEAISESIQIDPNKIKSKPIEEEDEETEFTFTLDDILDSKKKIINEKTVDTKNIKVYNLDLEEEVVEDSEFDKPDNENIIYSINNDDLTIELDDDLPVIDYRKNIPDKVNENDYQNNFELNILSTEEISESVNTKESIVSEEVNSDINYDLDLFPTDSSETITYNNITPSNITLSPKHLEDNVKAVNSIEIKELSVKIDTNALENLKNASNIISEGIQTEKQSTAEVQLSLHDEILSEKPIQNYEEIKLDLNPETEKVDTRPELKPKTALENFNPIHPEIQVQDTKNNNNGDNNLISKGSGTSLRKKNNPSLLDTPKVSNLTNGKRIKKSY